MFVVHVPLEDIIGTAIVAIALLVIAFSFFLIWLHDFKVRTKNRFEEWKKRRAQKKEEKKHGRDD